MKNKSMNKILALGVVAAMTAGMLAGCGSSASTTDGAAAGTEAASNSAASNGEVPTLVWWTIGGTPAGKGAWCYQCTAWTDTSRSSMRSKGTDR